MKVLTILFASALFVPAFTPAQEPAVAPSGAMRSGLAVGDTIEVHLYDFPDVGLVSTHVYEDGTIHLPYAGTLQALGKTPEQLQEIITAALRDKQIVKEPNVTVDVVSAVNMTVQVLGEVRAPRSIPVYSAVPVSFVLGQAGGLTGLASHQVTILHRDQPPTSLDYDPQAPTAATMNTMVQPGEVVSVSNLGVIFVSGEVNRPGIYSLGGTFTVVPNSNSSPVKEMTLLQALTQAGGITQIAARSKMRILRAVDGKREEIIVDEVKLYKGEVADPILHPNDIVYVPSSYIRTATNNLFSTALSSLTAATYVRQF